MFTKWIDDTLDAQVRDLQALVRIPSVSRGEPQEGMPLGQGVHDALTAALALANRLGFADTRSLDGLCGLVDYGEGDEMLCIMAHLDVVPAGAGWDGDPFSGELRDGRVFGRGTADDKGAAVSALYALAAVKAAGIPMRRRVRILLGCDEEAGWRCIDRYKETEPEPDLAFTPDADYPLVHSEMGICHAVYTRALSGCGLSIDCGTASNVVPGEAAATLPCPAVPCDAPSGMAVETDGHTVRVKGFGGHAASPELARNALQGLLAALAQQPLDAEALSLVTSLHALLDFDLHGEGFGPRRDGRLRHAHARADHAARGRAGRVAHAGLPLPVRRDAGAPAGGARHGVWRQSALPAPRRSARRATSSTRRASSCRRSCPSMRATRATAPSRCRSAAAPTRAPSATPSGSASCAKGRQAAATCRTSRIAVEDLRFNTGRHGGGHCAAGRKTGVTTAKNAA